MVELEAILVQYFESANVRDPFYAAALVRGQSEDSAGVVWWSTDIEAASLWGRM
jgi:hypothetical protein